MGAAGTPPAPSRQRPSLPYSPGAPVSQAPANRCRPRRSPPALAQHSAERQPACPLRPGTHPLAGGSMLQERADSAASYCSRQQSAGSEALRRHSGGGPARSQLGSGPWAFRPVRGKTYGLTTARVFAAPAFPGPAVCMAGLAPYYAHSHALPSPMPCVRRGRRGDTVVLAVSHRRESAGERARCPATPRLCLSSRCFVATCRCGIKCWCLPPSRG